MANQPSSQPALSLSTMFKLVLADIMGNKRLCLWFVLNLAIGLFGFTVIDVIKEGLSDVLMSKAREISGSDLEISGRKPVSDDDWQQLLPILSQGVDAGADANTGPKPYVMERYTSLYSMVEQGDSSLLVRVNGVGAAYPLYGSVTLQGSKEKVSGADLTGGKAWLTGELAERMALKAGSTIKVAGKPLTVAGIISQDSSSAMFNNRLAPELFTSIDFLTTSGLLTTGSIATYRRQFRYPSTMAAADLIAIKDQLSDRLAAKGYRVSSYKDQSNGRVLLYTADFLGLVSLMAFFLSCLGCGYLFLGYFRSKITDIGVFKALGASTGTINRMLLCSAIVLALAAVAVALGLAAILAPFAFNKLQQLFTLGDLPLGLTSTALKVTAMAIVCAVMISAPILSLVRQISPSVLLGNSQVPALAVGWRQQKWPMIAIGVAILAAIFGFSLWQAESVRVGGAFFGTFVALLVALAVFAGITVAILMRWPLPRSLNLRLALCRLRTEGAAFAFCVVALGLGMTIVQAIHHIKYSIQAEISVQGEQGKRPGLFLFDIQDDQYEGLRKIIGPLVDDSQTIVSPMIRGRFTQLPRRKSYDDMTTGELGRDREWRERMENRGINLSYRAQLSASERLVAGRLPVATYTEGEPAEVTIEQDYARRMDLRLGDTLGLDVSGLPLEAKVVGLRKVKWNSFQPNFFIQVQKGVLEDFPKTYVAAIAPRPSATNLQIKSAIMAGYPTISIIDVDTLIDKLLSLMAKLTLMLNATALLALAAGVVVMVSIIATKMRERQWDLNVMKILGGQRRMMFRQLVIDYGLLAVIAAGTSLGLGMVMAYSLITVLFETEFRADWQFAGLSSAGLILLFVAIALTMTESLVRKKPSLVSQED